MELKINRNEKISASISMPGDKSISHRAIIISSLARGESKIGGLLESDDCLHTLEIMRSLGIKIKKNENYYIIEGKGLHGLSEPQKILNCGNSGTTMRLLSGLLSAQNFYSVLTGDNSLKQRPMQRIKNPLKKMNAAIWARKGGFAPLSIKGQKLKGIRYKQPTASAQVKSAILLAALYAKEKTIIEEPAYSRDHTERMLQAAGVKLKRIAKTIILHENKERILKPLEIDIPGDISSASFFIAAALLIPDSQLIIKNVGINPSRTGFIEVVKKMGGRIEVLKQKKSTGEPSADILIKSSNLKGIEINKNIIPRLIDEIPIIAVLASQAKGKTIIRNAAELRVKETDRIKAMTNELKKLGANIEEKKDGMIISGPTPLRGGIYLNSYQDHRVAMSLAIAGLITDKEIIIKNAEVIDTSFPQFTDLLSSI